MDFKETYQDTVSTTALAARGGHVDILKELIESGRSVDVKDNRGWISLHEAAFSGNLECLKIILQHQQDEEFVDFCTFEEETPLMLACRAGRPECVKLLLESGADATARTFEDYTPLWEATVSNNLACVKHVIQAGADLERAIYTGDRPLHHASQKGYADLVQCLLDEGADIAAQADYNLTPLFLATQFGKSECLKLLIDAAAKKGEEYKVNYVNTTADDKATPLYLAAQEGHADCVDLLLAHGADPHLYVQMDMDPGHYLYPLQAAIVRESTRCLELLLKVTDIERFDWPMFNSGRKMIGDLDKPPSACYQPLYMAMDSDDVACLQLLISHGYLKQYIQRVKDRTIGNIFQSVPLRLHCVVLLVKHCAEFIHEQFTTGNWELYSVALFESERKESILATLLRVGAPCVVLLHRTQLLWSPRISDVELIVLLCKYMYRQAIEARGTKADEERSNCMENMKIFGPNNWEKVDMTLLVKLCLTSNILSVQQNLEPLLPNRDDKMPSNAQEGRVSDIVWKCAEGIMEKRREAIVHCKEKFHTLQHICRVNIVFKLLNANNYTREAIQMLGLPKPLQSYLLYSDVGYPGEILVEAAEASVKSENCVDKLFKEIKID